MKHINGESSLHNDKCRGREQKSELSSRKISISRVSSLKYFQNRTKKY